MMIPRLDQKPKASRREAVITPTLAMKPQLIPNNATFSVDGVHL
jgi:hypothetical protein